MMKRRCSTHAAYACLHGAAIIKVDIRTPYSGLSAVTEATLNDTALTINHFVFCT